MEKLNEQQIEEALKTLPGWKAINGKLEKEFEFESFQEEMFFVNTVAGFAEDQYHHPEIDVRFKKVMVRLSTFLVKGISESDRILAGKIEHFVQKIGKQEHDKARQYL